MRVKYNSKQSTVTVTLSYTEVRQFLSIQAAVEVVRNAIKAAMRLSGSDLS